MQSEIHEPNQLGIVLIHGSMLGSWIWERVTPHLSHPFIAADLPGRGSHPAEVGGIRLADAARSVLSDIEEAGFEQAVLVGHSLGGVVAVAAAGSLGSSVKHLVFMSSVVPRDHHSWVDELPFPNRALLEVVLRLQRNGARAPDRSFRASTAHDIDETTLRDMILPRLVPEAQRLFLDNVSWGAAKEIPRTYVRLTEDHDVGLDLQDRVISHLSPVEVIDVESGHLPMVTQPEQVADVINRVVDKVRGLESA